jgi:hypothetical protein
MRRRSAPSTVLPSRCATVLLLCFLEVLWQLDLVRRLLWVVGFAWLEPASKRLASHGLVHMLLQLLQLPPWHEPA